MIGYSSYRDPRLQPPDEDDRWQAIAEKLEEEYGTGDELDSRIDDVLGNLDLIPDFASIFKGHRDDLPAAAERFVRRVLGLVEDKIKSDACDEAVAQVERADELAREDAGEDAYYAQRERWVA